MNKEQFVPVEVARAEESLVEAEEILELREAELKIHFRNDVEFGEKVIKMAKSNCKGFKDLKDSKYIIGTIKPLFPEKCMSFYQNKALNYYIGALIRRNIAEGILKDLEELY